MPSSQPRESRETTSKRSPAWRIFGTVRRIGCSSPTCGWITQHASLSLTALPKWNCGGLEGLVRDEAGSPGRCRRTPRRSFSSPLRARRPPRPNQAAAQSTLGRGPFFQDRMDEAVPLLVQAVSSFRQLNAPLLLEIPAIWRVAAIAQCRAFGDPMAAVGQSIARDRCARAICWKREGSPRRASRRRPLARGSPVGLVAGREPPSRPGRPAA